MMPGTPIWLARPTRFAALSRRAARIVLAVLALAMLLAVASLSAPSPPAASDAGSAHSVDDQRDILLYEEIVDAVRHGGNYYEVAASELRAGHYPLRPFFTMRPPGLARIQAALPLPLIVALLYALVLAVMAAWAFWFRASLSRWPGQAVAIALLAGGLMAFVQADLWAFHEIWAGLLVALALVVRRPGRWIEAVALGLMAALIRETAVLALAVMAAAAWVEGERREAFGWAAAIAIVALALAFHAWGVSQVVGPLDQASPGWSGLLGPGFFIHSVRAATALVLAPEWLAAVLVVLALLGWCACRDPLALRVLGVILSYAAVLSLFARVDTFYWVLLVAPLMLVGLAFAPDALRDLLRQARGTRRVVVTELTR